MKILDEDQWKDMSVSALESLKLSLKEEYQTIEAQLGDPERETTEEDFLTWRRKAKWALLQKKKTYGRLGQYLKDRKRLMNEGEDSIRLYKASLLAREAGVDDILAMAEEERRDLIDRCSEAAKLLLTTDK